MRRSALVLAVLLGCAVRGGAPAGAVSVAAEAAGTRLLVGGYLASLFGAYRYFPELGMPDEVVGIDQEHLKLELVAQIREGWDLALTYDNYARVGPLSSASREYFRSRAPDRFLDLERSYLDSRDMVAFHELDRLYCAFVEERVQCVIGRQAISWGRGRVWSPTDLFISLVPTEMQRDEKPGVDALRVQLPFGKAARLDMVCSPGREQRWTSWGARASWRLGRTAVSGMAGSFRTDHVLGLDAARSIGHAQVFLDAAYTWPQDSAAFWRGVLGAEWGLASVGSLTCELYYNGFGSDDPADYLELAQSPRFQLGEVANLGRHMAAVLAEFYPSYTGTIYLRVLGNVDDRSVLVNPWASWQLGDYLLLRAGGYISAGRRPAEELRSEFGSYPDFYYAELRLQF
jgi:hypothetical protein